MEKLKDFELILPPSALESFRELERSIAERCNVKNRLNRIGVMPEEYRLAFEASKISIANQLENLYNHKCEIGSHPVKILGTEAIELQPEPMVELTKEEKRLPKNQTHKPKYKFHK